MQCNTKVGGYKQVANTLPLRRKKYSVQGLVNSKIGWQFSTSNI